MDFDASVQRERRRDFARRYVVEKAIGALLQSSVDLSAVTVDSRISELTLPSTFSLRIADGFGSIEPPHLYTLGGPADFLSTHHTPASRPGRRMQLFAVAR